VRYSPSSSRGSDLINSDLRAQVQRWIDDEVDPVAAKELSALLAGGADAELADRFSAPLSFGTAGLRGPLRAGPNGMNRAVVRRAAAGIAAWLPRGGRVIIGYDGRHGSAEFARDSAAIFAAAGHEAMMLPRLLPTPVLAFAVRRLGAVLGVMVTASHNPPQDNGYKVYLGDGAQIVPPVDAEIEAAIHAVGPARAITLDDSFTVLGEDIVDDYVAAVASLISAGPRDVRIVHTAMHGVGTEVIRQVLRVAGFLDVISVPEQAQPDADFPTVAFPNPEEPGALDLAFALARDRGADLVIANDPDADRCAVAVADTAGWRMLRGDEVGVLLADSLLRKGVRGTYATTIVSSTMLSVMARRHHMPYAETLTGFKWIARAAPDLAFGYEEALGYAVAPDLVKDKDGVSAGLLIAELAASLKSVGSSLSQRLEELAAEYGRHVTDQISVRVDDLSIITGKMVQLRSGPPAVLLGAHVFVTDRMPEADVVTLSFAGGRVVVRPSGTEPKLKAYLEVVLDGPPERGQALLEQLRAEVTAALGL
jgi:phosphomannomutase